MFTILDIDYIEMVLDFIYSYGLFIVVIAVLFKIIGIVIKNLNPNSNVLKTFKREINFRKLKLPIFFEITFNLCIIMLFIIWTALRIISYIN